MIIIVSGVPTNYNNNQNNRYKQEYYQPTNKVDLKEKVKEDFGDMLSVEMSKLKINVLI